MTEPLSNANVPGTYTRGVTPGESEFSWGEGLAPPVERGAVPTQMDLLIAMRQTDPANPDASEEATRVKGARNSYLGEDGIYVAGELRVGATAVMREAGPSSTSGQHTPIDVNRYEKTHQPDGQQDGLGAAWRDSLPPNPVV